MANNWQTVRVFISSTFRDMQAERDHLVRFVFPRLREELLKRRIHLVDVDLRWGVTSEQDALSVCREVVDECRPRFLCMLGGRYGWVPPGKNRSITADEVHYGVLDRDLKSRGFAYFYFRDPSATSAMVEAAPGEFREPVGSPGCAALVELKSAIIETGLQPFTYRAQRDEQSRRLIGLKEFGDRVYEDLKQSIDQEFGTTTGEKPDEFTEENSAMEAFIEERVQRFVLGSRESMLNELLAHASATGGNGYVCVTGVPGSGKSALLANLSQRLILNPEPSTILISHFVGASPGSTDVRRTLRRLCHELATGAGLTAEIPEDPEKLRVAFSEILKQACAKKRVVILLDAINQFDPATQLSGWSWLPEELPDTARIILSTLSVISNQSSVVGPALDSLRQRRQPPRPVELKPLDEQDREAIIREFLNRYRKSMTHDQCAALLAKADAGTPLYLLVALEELRTLGTYEEITNRIAQLPTDTRALFIWILKRLEDDEGFRDASGRKIGRELVSRFVSLMGTSRHGLSQQELVELLSPGDTQGNVAALAQLLRPYLMQRGELLDFYHGQFREAVATAYLPSESQRLAAHDQLATYFRNLADPDKNQSWKGNSPRPFLQVVFHLVGAEDSDDYCQILCDLRFVEARCRMGQVFELISDYRMAQENLPEAQEDLRKERERQECIARWTREIIAYAKAWSDRRDQQSTAGATSLLSSPEPQLPTPPPSCRMSTDEEIQAESTRIIRAPTRRDRVEAFAGFVSGQCYPLIEHGKRPGFVWQHAFNAEPAGAVHNAVVPLLAALKQLHVLRHWPPEARPKPKPALLRTLEGHTSHVNSVSVTADGLRAVSGSYDRALRVWDLTSGQCLRTLEGHISIVYGVSVTPDGFRAVSGSGDDTLRVWDLTSGQCLRILKGHSGSVYGVSVTADGLRAISGSYDRALRVWDLTSGQCLRILEGHTWHVWSVSVTPDGLRAVSGSGDETLRVWDLTSGQCLRILKGHSGSVYGVSVTADGLRAVSGSDDKTLRVWDLTSGECLRILEGHTSRVTAVSVTADGLRAISGSWDKTLRVWDLTSGECLRILEGHTSHIYGVSVTADGLHAVSGSWDYTLRVWDLPFGQFSRTLECHTSDVLSVSVTADGLRAVSGSFDKTLRVWDLTSGQCLRTLEVHNFVFSVSATLDGLRAVSGCRDCTLRVWDLTSGECLLALSGHTNLVHSVGVIPDGRRVISGSFDKTLRVWDLSSGECLRTLDGHSDSVNCVSVTPDGLRVVSGCWHWDKALRVWDLSSGECLRTLDGHSDSVNCVSVTPDGRRAVSGGSDKTVRMWDLESGQCLRTLEGHNLSVNSVSVTPEGRCAVSGSEDCTLRVWDLESGACLAICLTAAPVSATAMFAGKLVVGLRSGDVLVTETRNIPIGVAILTPANPQQARCPVCGQAFAPPSVVVAAIEERIQETEDRIQKSKTAPPSSDLRPLASAFLSSCPHCQYPLQFNPFFSAAEDYAKVLGRGLAFSRREKGPDHEETLAHLVALAVHLENAGKLEEAAEFKREHDEIAAKKKEKTAGATNPLSPSTAAVGT